MIGVKYDIKVDMAFYIDLWQACVYFVAIYEVVVTWQLQGLRNNKCSAELVRCIFFKTVFCTLRPVLHVYWKPSKHFMAWSSAKIQHYLWDVIKMLIVSNGAHEQNAPLFGNGFGSKLGSFDGHSSRGEWCTIPKILLMFNRFRSCLICKTTCKSWR